MKCGFNTQMVNHELAVKNEDKKKKLAKELQPIKFTFKTEKPTGRYRSFEHNYHIIKLNKLTVGYIGDGMGFKITLHVYKTEGIIYKNPNCPWVSITFKKESDSLQEAKDWLNLNRVSIMKKYRIYQLPE